MSAIVADSFEKLGLHTNVCVALSAKGIVGPYPRQAAALQHTTRDLCDVLATVQPHTGRHTLLISFAAHCVLAANVPKFALIIANTTASATKMSNVAKMLNIMGVTPSLVLDAADKTRTSGCVTPSIVITTLATINKWPREEFLKCASLLVEDASMCSGKDLEGAIHTVARPSDPTNLFLLTTQNIKDVGRSLRYALHRRRRRFCPANPSPPSYAFMLATDNDDRLALLRKVVEIKALRRVMVLTHSKEVKDLRMKLQHWGLNTFALGRNAIPSEQSSVINEFVNSTYGVLVASDAFAGIDLLDVDGVIQFYPPQKSMDEDEWSDFIRCIRTTCNPVVPTRFVTLLGTDDFTLGAYFMKRAECDGLILNVSPNHSRFADIVLNPIPATLERVSQPLPNAIEVPKPAGKGNKGGNNANNNGNNNNASSNNNTNNNNSQANATKNSKDANKGGASNNNKGGNNGNNNGNNNGKQTQKEKEAAAAKERAAREAAEKAKASEEPLSNRAKRRLAQEETRKKQDAASKAKEEQRAKEEARAREKEANRQREREIQAARAKAKEEARLREEAKAREKEQASANSSPSDGGEVKSKRQQRRDNYHAETKLRNMAAKEAAAKEASEKKE